MSLAYFGWPYGARPITLYSPELILKPAWSECEIGLEEALELHEGLVVERDVAQVAERDAPFPETVADRFGREPGIVLLAIEPLLLRRRDDLAVAKKTRRAIVVESRDA